MSKLITGGSLNTDVSPIYLKETEHSFALNMVTSSDDGDINTRSNDNANESCINFPEYGGKKMILIGKVYIGNGQTLVFLVSDDEVVSEIGVFGDNCTYTTETNDRLSATEDRLNFKIGKPVDAVYRLRRGCDRTVYFTDDYNRPRYFNLDKPYDFLQITNNKETAISSRFNLFNSYEITPLMGSFKVQEGGGLMSGSYNFAIQYVDSELNATEWVTSSETVQVFEDNLKNPFSTIFGSTGMKTFYREEKKTNKAIKFNIVHLGTVTLRPFPYYRVAAICANNGSGIPNKVLVSQLIDFNVNEFIFDNESTMESEISIEEIQTNQVIIERAKNIEQSENRLILSNTEGKQTKYCNLQKYASRIKADCVLEEIDLTNIEGQNNTKAPTVHTKKVGYQPGEIYSFGIVYIFKDRTVSPVYHIPGKNHSTDGVIFSGGDNVYAMDIENECQSIDYVETNACQNSGLWGKDSEGVDLAGQGVRHHRFPLRSKLKKPLITQTTTTVDSVLKKIWVKIYLLRDDQNRTIAYFKVTYTINGITYTKIINFKLTNLTPPLGQYGAFYGIIDSSTSTVVINSVTYCDENGVSIPDGASDNWDSSTTVESGLSSYNIKETKFTTKSEIFGIKFSGIDIPSIADINDEVIGYYIVRNERLESDKTILDTGVLFPLLNKHEKFVASGMMFPRAINKTDIDDKTYSVVHPEYKFHDKQYSDYTVIQEGYFKRTDFRLTTNLIQDVQAGTSFNAEVNTGDDNDGFDLRTLSRQNWLEYEMLTTPIITPPAHIEDYFTLNVLRSKEVEYTGGIKKDIFNVCGDNNEAHFTLKDANKRTIIEIGDNTIGNKSTEDEIKAPQVVLKKEGVVNYYQNYKTRPYYKQGEQNAIATSEIIIFGGDSYISSMNYHRSIFHEFRLGEREKQSAGFFQVIAGAVVALAGVAALVFSLGIAAPLAIGAITLGVGIATTGVMSHIEMGEINDIYQKKWEEGLKDCVKDKFTEAFFINAKDDELRWFTDTATNLWFESQVNCNWRLKADQVTYFLNSPDTLISSHNLNDAQFNNNWGNTMYYGNPNPGPNIVLGGINGTSVSMFPRNTEATTSTKDYINSYVLSKLTVVDGDNKGGRLYKLNSNPEIYDENLDFKRRNKEKIYFHIADEYDCCSKCTEDFPHRIHYSPQSYQEELSDNYKNFLVNDYRDIEGELGEIMDVFSLGNELFIHTKEALWRLPKGYQERVQNDIVTFIGDGGFFNVPPQKIIDDDTGSSVGIQHKWSSVKTIDTYYFVTEREKKIYAFNGKSLIAISDSNNRQWFWENIGIEKDQLHFDTNKKEYPYRDNTSNPIGTGYISTYDAEKRRVLFTKKDYQLTIPHADYDICYKNGVATIFPNISTTVTTQQGLGKTYLGIENCRLKFVKNVIATRTETRTVRRNKFKDVDFLVFRYNFNGVGSDDLDTRTELLTPVAKGPIGFNRNINYNGVYLQWGGDNQGLGVEAILIDIKKIKQDFPLATEITFKCGAWWYGSRGTGDMNMNAQGFQGGTMANVGFDFANTGGTLMGSYSFPTVNINVPPTGNAGTNDANFQPYNDMGTFTYKIDTGELSANGLSGGSVPPEEEIVTEVVTISYLVPEYSYVDGVPLNTSGKLNTGFTVSYDIPIDNIRPGAWVGWHSFIPDFYIHTQKTFYSWLNGQSTLWKHGAKGVYQKYYGTSFPFILELNIRSEDMENKIWDFISFLTEAKLYNNTTKSYLNINDITFDKIIFYNSRQSSNLLTITHKNYASVWDVPSTTYPGSQIVDSNTTVIADKNEKEWTINHIRDYVVSKSEPLFIENKAQILNTGNWIDKLVNPAAMSLTKTWTQQEVMRDKFITIRFIFNNFAEHHNANSIKLIFNYLRDKSITSFR